MHEPLLDVGIPSEMSRLGRVFRTGAHVGEKVIIIQQIYNNIAAQERLCEVCRLLAVEGGVRLITVEGADAQLQPRSGVLSVATLLTQRCQVSAGLEVLLSQGLPGVMAWGVDDLDSESRSFHAMNLALKAADRRERVFLSIRELLRTAQLRCYPTSVAQLRLLQCALYGRWQETSHTPGLTGYAKSLSQPVASVVSEITNAARAVGLDLRDFPAIPLYQRLMAQEKRLRKRRARIEQKIFIERLVSRVLSAAGGPQGLDMKLLGPVIQFWGETNTVSNKEFESSIKLRGLEAVLSECFQWMVGWLMESAVATTSGRSDSADVFEMMMRLALRLDVPYYDLHRFRDVVAYLRETAGIAAGGIFDQINECGRVLAGRSSNPIGGELFNLEQGLEQFYFALRLELVPVEAEATDITLSAFSDRVHEVCRLGGYSRTDVAACGLDTLSDIINAAREFYDLSRARGRLMAERTLELMKAQGEDRAILLAGGFHERTITRAFEDHRNVSWSVLLPQPKF